MEDQKPKSRGRAPLYRELFVALDPLCLYSAATIADFAVKEGMLDLLNPKKMVRAKKKRERIRIAAAHHCRRKEHPKSDDYVINKGRRMPASFGWCWQGFEDEKAAILAVFLHLQPIWQGLASQCTYCVQDLLEKWDRAQSDAPIKKGLHALYRVQTKIMLTRHGQMRGLEPGKPYFLKEWNTPLHELVVKQEDFRTIAGFLNEGSNYTYDCILNLFFNKGLIEDQEAGYARCLRSGLFRLAQKHSFPVSGDQQFCSTGCPPQASWSGLRWKKALNSSQEVPSLKRTSSLMGKAGQRILKA